LTATLRVFEDARVHHFVALAVHDRVAEVERRPAPEPLAWLRVGERLRRTNAALAVAVVAVAAGRTAVVGLADRARRRAWRFGRGEPGAGGALEVARRGRAVKRVEGAVRADRGDRDRARPAKAVVGRAKAARPVALGRADALWRRRRGAELYGGGVEGWPSSSASVVQRKRHRRGAGSTHAERHADVPDVVGLILLCLRPSPVGCVTMKASGRARAVR
jgi:hypothetical protein